MPEVGPPPRLINFPRGARGTDGSILATHDGARPAMQLADVTQQQLSADPSAVSCAWYF